MPPAGPSGWRKGWEPTRRGSGRTRTGEDVEDLVGLVANEVEVLQGERGPGAVTHEAFEAGPVVGLVP